MDRTISREDNLLSRIFYKSAEIKLESLLLRPNNEKELPGIVLLHGHGGSAWDMLFLGNFLCEKGFVVWMPTQIGYFPSDGQLDYCGPKTVHGVIDGINIFLGQQGINPEKIGIWGISRGGTVAALVAEKLPRTFKAGVFQSGGYNLENILEETKIEGIKEAIIKEAGVDQQSLKERSPIFEAENIDFPVLILHGENDDRYPVRQVISFDARLKELGKIHETVIIPGGQHIITRDTRKDYTFPFLSKYLLKK